jgi:hypothetical protein
MKCCAGERLMEWHDVQLNVLCGSKVRSSCVGEEVEGAELSSELEAPAGASGAGVVMCYNARDEIGVQLGRNASGESAGDKMRGRK